MPLTLLELFQQGMYIVWHDRHALLKHFKKRKRYYLVLESHPLRMEQIWVGGWVKARCQLQKKKTLDPDRPTLLEEFDFEWVLVLPSATWD